MRDRGDFWLKRGLYPLLSKHFYCAHQVIWSDRTPADLHWIIVNSKGAYLWAAPLTGRHEGDGMKRWTRQIRLKLNEKPNEYSLPFMLLRCHQVDSFVCFFFVSSFLLLNFLPNSSFPSFPRMITSPKNVFLQVFNTFSLKHGPSGCFVCALLF